MAIGAGAGVGARGGVSVGAGAGVQGGIGRGVILGVRVRIGGAGVGVRMGRRLCRGVVRYVHIVSYLLDRLRQAPRVESYGLARAEEAKRDGESIFSRIGNLC